MYNRFEVGEWAKWESSSYGTTKTKVAQCVKIVPAGESVNKMINELDINYSRFNISTTSQTRDCESYLFALKPNRNDVRVLYWPRVYGLHRVNPEEA